MNRQTLPCTRCLRPRWPEGGMLVFPVGVDKGLYQSASSRVLAAYRLEEWQSGQSYTGQFQTSGLRFNKHSLTLEITGITRPKLFQAAERLAHKCAVPKVLLLDFAAGQEFVVHRKPVSPEEHHREQERFVEGFYKALEEEKLIRGDEFQAFLQPKAKYRFPGEMFYHIKQAKKRFIRYFFLTIDTYPHNIYCCRHTK